MARPQATVAASGQRSRRVHRWGAWSLTDRTGIVSVADVEKAARLSSAQMLPNRPRVVRRRPRRIDLDRSHAARSATPDRTKVGTSPAVRRAAPGRPGDGSPVVRSALRQIVSGPSSAPTDIETIGTSRRLEDVVRDEFTAGRASARGSARPVSVT